ncbi:MAG: DUF393 domain-containing protein [Anaerolineae bacterium]|nr:DUF393 domain-containing protein [Anaerolineae bacterium]
MPTVIYDGACGLCTTSVRLLRRLDWLHRLTYLDAQAWETVHARYPQLEVQAVLGAIHVITAGGRILAGYAGVRHLLRFLPLLIWLYPLLFVPGITWLGPRVYDWVAAHRYTFNRVFGFPATCESGTCRVHAVGSTGGGASVEDRPQRG